MSEARKAKLNTVMLNMDPSFRGRWCDPIVECGCLGCADVSGGLANMGFTREEWRCWAADHPEFNSTESV